MHNTCRIGFVRILGIETSCDETAAAVVEDGQRLLSNVIASSIDLHKAYGGVVPEIAARSHLEVIIPVIDEALKTAKTDWSSIDAIAVTYGPGLAGSLLIGVMTAKTLALAHKKPLYAINHVQAHPYAAFLADKPEFPMLSLIVSGGHTQLVLFESHSSYQLLGQTQDDAVGEAFDKAAKMLGLPYPGGPSIAEAASHGDPKKYRLPKAKTAGKYDFSYSGLKTALLRVAQQQTGHDYTFPSTKLPEALSAPQKQDLAASFQHIAISMLVDRLQMAVQQFKPASVVVAGGVAANQELRTQIAEAKIDAIFPDIKLCTDNAAMIAVLAYFQSQNSEPSDPSRLTINPSLAM